MSVDEVLEYWRFVVRFIAFYGAIALLAPQGNAQCIRVEQLRDIFRHVHGDCADADSLFQLYASADDGLLHRAQFEQLAKAHPAIVAAAVQSLWARFPVPTPRAGAASVSGYYWASYCPYMSPHKGCPTSCVTSVHNMELLALLARWHHTSAFSTAAVTDCFRTQSCSSYSRLHWQFGVQYCSRCTRRTTPLVPTTAAATPAPGRFKLDHWHATTLLRYTRSSRMRCFWAQP
jgi:hypothetical protein